MSKKEKKIILAYSGGLDTSVILHWLAKTYSAEVIAFTADIGQEHDPKEVKQRAEDIGASKVIIEDLKEEFIQDYVFPMFRANTLYEGEYLLGTSIARPLISKRLIEIANKENAHAISHGATGKGNDQIRFEIGAYALNPDIEVISPWREWNYSSRADLIEYCQEHDINLDINRAVQNDSPSARLITMVVTDEYDFLFNKSPLENVRNSSFYLFFSQNLWGQKIGKQKFCL